MNVLVLLSINWLTNLFSPIDAIRDALVRRYDDVKRLRKLVHSFWLFPILLSMALDGLVFFRFGINLVQNVPFLILYTTAVALRLLAGPAILFATLAALGARMRLGLIFVCYTVVVIYSPFVSVTDMPSSFVRFETVKDVLSQNLSFLDSLSYFRDNVAALNAKHPLDLGTLYRLFASAIGVLTLCVNVALAEVIVQAGKLDRVKAYVAVCWTGILMIFPQLIFLGMETAAALNYISK
jgi:hypothetical protein